MVGVSRHVHMASGHLVATTFYFFILFYFSSIFRLVGWVQVYRYKRHGLYVRSLFILMHDVEFGCVLVFPTFSYFFFFKFGKIEKYFGRHFTLLILLLLYYYCTVCCWVILINSQKYCMYTINTTVVQQYQ